MSDFNRSLFQRSSVCFPFANMQTRCDVIGPYRCLFGNSFSVRNCSSGCYVMDGYLDSLGLYRSDVANDSTCLFRAVSEQLFYTQYYHEYLKEKCIKYMQRHRNVFEPLVIDLDSHLEGLNIGHVWAGPVEMHALALKYKLNFEVYDRVGISPNPDISIQSQTIVLVGFGGNRYDCAYSKSYLSASAVCQSIAYEILYKDVYNIGDAVDTAVERMLHDKNYSKQRKNMNQMKHNTPSTEEDIIDFQRKDQDPCLEIKKALELGIPPFPYKVAKALDPNIYRNVEFDIWNEQKREHLKNEQYVTPPLGPGVKCNVHLEKDGKKCTLLGHVQELNKDVITVYVEKLCERYILTKEEIEIISVPQYKVSSWPGGKSYRMFGEFSKFDIDKKNKKRNHRKNQEMNMEEQVHVATSPKMNSFCTDIVPKDNSHYGSGNFSKTLNTKAGMKAHSINPRCLTYESKGEDLRASPPSILPPVPANLSKEDSGYVSCYMQATIEGSFHRDNSFGSNVAIQSYQSSEEYATSPYVDSSEGTQNLTPMSEIMSYELHTQAITSSTPLQIPRTASYGRHLPDDVGTVALTPGTPNVTYLPYPAYYAYPDPNAIPLGYNLLACCITNEMNTGLPSMYINTPPPSGVTPPRMAPAWYANTIPQQYGVQQSISPNFYACSPPVMNEVCPGENPMYEGLWGSPPINYMFPAASLPMSYQPAVAPMPEQLLK